MKPTVCAIALFYFLVAVGVTEGVHIAVDDLVKKMQTELKEKGNECTSGKVDTIRIGDASWTVKCSYYGEKFFRVKSAYRRDGVKETMTVELLTDGTIRFLKLNGQVEQRYNTKGAVAYFEDEFHDHFPDWKW